MHQVYQIELLSQGKALRNQFLTKMFKIYGSEFNCSPKKKINHDNPEEQFREIISVISEKQLSNWNVQIQGVKFSFLCDIDKNQYPILSTILLFEVDEEISEETVDTLKKYYYQSLNFLIIINKFFDVTEDTIKGYRQKIIASFEEEDIEIKQECIIEVCLNEHFNIPEDLFSHKWIQMAQQKQEIIKIQSSKLGERLSQKLKSIQCSKEQFIASWKIERIKSALNQSQIIKFYEQLNKKSMPQSDLSSKYMQFIQEDEKVKINLKQNKFQSIFNTFKDQVNFQIQNLQMNRLAKDLKQQGMQAEKQAIIKLKQIQINEERQLEEEQIKEQFIKVVPNLFEEAKLSSAQQQNLKIYLQKITMAYLKESALNNLINDDLSKQGWKSKINLSYTQLSDKIKNQIFREAGTDSKEYIQFRNNPPTKILDESAKTDATLQFFNMRNYYCKKKVERFYDISTDDLKECLKIEQIKNEMESNFAMRNTSDGGITTIFEKSNQLLIKYGFEMEDIKNFEWCFGYQLEYSRYLINEPLLEIKLLPNMQSILLQKINQQINNHQKLYCNLSKDMKKRAPQKSVGNFLEVQVQFPMSSVYQKLPLLNQINQNENINNSLQMKMVQKKPEINKNEEQLTENLNFINHYIDISRLKSILVKMKNPNINKIIMFLCKNVKRCIKWSNIQKFISKNKDNKNIKLNINQMINKILNSDLEKLGLSISCSNYYQYICNQKKEINLIFSSKGQMQLYHKQDTFFQKFKNLKKIDESKLRQKLKISCNKSPSDGDLRMGAYQQYEQIFEVRPEYKNINQLTEYISQEKNQSYSNLQNETVRQFAYHELVRTHSFQKLFKNIEVIIFESSDYFSPKTVISIYHNVNQQIIKFNNDLNQVCYRLSSKFAQQVHRYSIYLIWNKHLKTAKKEATKPFLEYQQTWLDKFHYFVSKISSNPTINSQGQSKQFLKYVSAYLRKEIKDFKQSVNINEAQKFKQNYSRIKIRQKIDQQCFNPQVTPEVCLNYLAKPASVIKQKYKSLTDQAVQNIANQYCTDQKVTKLFRQFKQSIGLLFQKLQSMKFSNETKHTDIFHILKNNQNEVPYSKVLFDMGELMMNYFLDLLVRDEKKVYFEKDFNMEINQKYCDLRIIGASTPNLKVLISKLLKKKMSITCLYPFVEMIYNKLDEKEVINGVQTCKYQEKLKKLIILNEKDEERFRSLVNVTICDILCPCCLRLCQVEQAHSNNHECKSGHQMRGFGGAMFSNGDASVIRCEEVPSMSQLKYNGRINIWSQWKKQWENKTDGSWIFPSTKNRHNNQFFIKAWEVAGQWICKKYSMNFVKSNNLQSQKRTSLAEPTHYIFALDDSGSMSGQSWQDLMNGYQKAIENLQNFLNAQQYIKVSTIVFNTSCRQFQQNVTLSEVVLEVPFQGGGTDFENAFDKAHNLMAKYVSTSNIQFIFMTDGDGQYPQKQVNQIKELKNQYPNKIVYSGILYNSDDSDGSEAIKRIGRQLGGTNRMTSNAVQLAQAYIEIINRK